MLNEAEEYTFYCLLEWVRKFDCVDKSIIAEDLCDGIIISKILHTIDSVNFRILWPGKFEEKGYLYTPSKTLYVNHIVGAISNFFTEVICQPLAIFQLPNAAQIAEENDVGELSRLLQLVLCCAVNCDNKQMHIQTIMNLESAMQQSIMESIKCVMSECVPSKENSEKPFTRDPTDEVSNLMARNTELAHRCHELEDTVFALQEEVTSLKTENEEMLDSFNKLQLHDVSPVGDASSPIHRVSTSGEPGSVPAKLQIRQLKSQLSDLREELYQSETAQHELKLKLSETMAELQEMKDSYDVLSRQAEETAQLKDELDIAREEASTANRLVLSMEQLRKKAEEASSLRIRCNKLEVDNAALLQHLDEIEQESRLNTSFRSNIESIRSQSAESQARVSDLSSRVEKSETEAEKLRADLKESIKEKTAVLNEYNRLKLRLESVFSSKALKDIHEVSDSSSAISSLQPSNLTSVKASKSGVDAREGLEMSDAVRRLLDQKEREHFEMEQRYRSYLLLAMEVISQLDRKAVSAPDDEKGVDRSVESSELARLRGLLAEKENIIEQLERHYAQTRSQRDIEERLVLTAWYHLSMRLNRDCVDHRLAAEETSSGQPAKTGHGTESFLARQRQIHLRSSPPLSFPNASES